MILSFVWTLSLRIIRLALRQATQRLQIALVTLSVFGIFRRSLGKIEKHVEALP